MIAAIKSSLVVIELIVSLNKYRVYQDQNAELHRNIQSITMKQIVIKIYQVNQKLISIFFVQNSNIVWNKINFVGFWHISIAFIILRVVI